MSKDAASSFINPQSHLHTSTNQPSSPRSLPSLEINGLNNINTHTKFYTIDDAISHSGFGRFQIQMLFVCGAVQATDALEVMLLTFLMPVIREQQKLKHGGDGVLGSVVFAGMIFGAAFQGPISDRYGRKIGYAGSIVCSAIFGLLSAIAPNLLILVLLRFCVGFGLGGAFVPYSLFAEFVPKNIRGRILMIEQVTFTLGALLGVALAQIVLDRFGWRWFVFQSAIPLVLNSLLYFFLLESPRYLLTKNRTQEAEQVLRSIARINRRPFIEGQLITHHQLHHHSNQSNLDRRTSSSILNLLSPGLRRSTLLLQIIQFSVTFVYYGISFITPRFTNFANSSSSGNSTATYISVLVTTLAELPGLLIPTLLIDKLGRRYTLFGSFIIAAIASYLMMIPIPHYPHAQHHAHDSLIVSTVKVFSHADTQFLFVCRMVIAGAFAATYIYTSEVYPTIIRTTGMGICIIFSRVAGIITTFIAEDIETFVAVLVFGSISMIASIASILLNISTSGLDLRDDILEIEEELSLSGTQNQSNESQHSSLKLYRKRKKDYNRLKVEENIGSNIEFIENTNEADNI